jgi:hypothetical protein
LNVKDAPAFSVVFAQVKMHVLEEVVAELPVPLSGVSAAPEGTASFVQWSPLGTLNETSKPVTAEDPVFSIVIVPQ